MRRAALDGSSQEELFTTANEVNFLTTRNQVTQLELDVVDRKLYWIKSTYTYRDDGGYEAGTHTIRRANLDGSDMKDLVTVSDRVPNFAIDAVGRKLYWSAYKPIDEQDSYGDGDWFIRRSNLDGTDNQVVFRARSIDSFAIDIVGRKLYWSEHDRILRANLDGGREEVVLSLPVPGMWIQALDGADGKMYYTYYSETHDGGVIGRANLDGTDAEDIVTEDAGYGIELVLGVH